MEIACADNRQRDQRRLVRRGGELWDGRGGEPWEMCRPREPEARQRESAQGNPPASLMSSTTER